MRLKFPKSSEETVKSLSKDVTFVADYIPDEDYDPLKIKFEADFSGGNKEMSDRDKALYLKYGIGREKVTLPDSIVKKEQERGALVVQ
jgi:hypothetical protein